MKITNYCWSIRQRSVAPLGGPAPVAAGSSAVLSQAVATDHLSIADGSPSGALHSNASAVGVAVVGQIVLVDGVTWIRP
jgi:hypothetical protein